MKTYLLLLGLALLVGAGCRTSESSQPTPEAPDSTGAAVDTATAPLDFAAAGLQEDEVRAFFSTLQDAVARDDRQRVARLVAYPLTVEVGDESVTLRTPAEFVGRYDQVINAYVRAAVAEETIGNLFVNWQGVRIGQGAVWFGGVYEEETSGTYTVKIIAVNPTPL